MTHLRNLYGQCLICRHYGKDCTGTRKGWTQSAMARQQKIDRIAAMRREADILQNQLNPAATPAELDLVFVEE